MKLLVSSVGAPPTASKSKNMDRKFKLFKLVFKANKIFNQMGPFRLFCSLKYASRTPSGLIVGHLVLALLLHILLDHGAPLPCAGLQQAPLTSHIPHGAILSANMRLDQQRGHTKPTNVMLYQQQHQQQLAGNLSTPLNRPLDRPSLTLVAGGSDASARSVSASSKHAKPTNATDDGVKRSGVIEADWFMLGGPSDSVPLDGDLASSESRHSHAVLADRANASAPSSTRRSAELGSRRKNSTGSRESTTNNRTAFESEQTDSSDSNEIFDDVEDKIALAGTQKEPECASHGRYYCTFKEDYPLKLVTEVTKYYKWPLEKLFRDLHAQIMPKLAQDASGNLVCDSITRVVRPGWARNTNERWLVVINTDNYHQYVTEVVCQYGTNSRCNFIPPCYYSSCQQRYNTQKLLVIDPTNPYRGPFLSEFLFPSCCVCYVPSGGEALQDKYRPSPATIYQRTMQQESSVNMNPPHFRPTGLMEEVGASSFSASGLAPPTSSASLGPTLQSSDKTPSGSSMSSSSNSKLAPPEPGEIRRRAGEQYRRRAAEQQQDESELSRFEQRLASSNSNMNIDASTKTNLVDQEILFDTNHR